MCCLLLLLNLTLLTSLLQRSPMASIHSSSSPSSWFMFLGVTFCACLLKCEWLLYIINIMFHAASRQKPQNHLISLISRFHSVPNVCFSMWRFRLSSIISFSDLVLALLAYVDNLFLISTPLFPPLRPSCLWPLNCLPLRNTDIGASTLLALNRYSFLLHRDRGQISCGLPAPDIPLPFLFRTRPHLTCQLFSFPPAFVYAFCEACIPSGCHSRLLWTVGNWHPWCPVQSLAQ